MTEIPRTLENAIDAYERERSKREIIEIQDGINAKEYQRLLRRGEVDPEDCDCGLCERPEPTEVPYLDPFADIARELIEIHDRKGADYGSANDPYTNVRMSEAFGLPAWIGVSVRMNDKMVRLQTAVRQYLTDGKVHLKQEGLLDIANDFAVYGIILRIMIEEAQASGELTDASEGNL